MMSASRTNAMNLCGLLFSLPLGKRGIGGGNRGDEDRWGVDFLDKELVRISFNDVKQAVLEHNIGWSLNQQFCVNQSPHSQTPFHKLPQVPEQLRNKAQPAPLNQPVTNMVSA